MCNRQFRFYVVSLHDLKERFRYNAYSSCDFTLVLAGTQKQQQIKGEKTKKLTLTILLCCKTINDCKFIVFMQPNYCQVCKFVNRYEISISKIQ